LEMTNRHLEVINRQLETANRHLKFINRQLDNLFDKREKAARQGKLFVLDLNFYFFFVSLRAFYRIVNAFVAILFLILSSPGLFLLFLGLFLLPTHYDSNIMLADCLTL
jgi:hypothetical protein